MHSYSKDGAMRMVNVSDPVYAPNSYGGPAADPTLTDKAGLWAADGEMVRAAYTLRAEDDDFGQAGTRSARCWTTRPASAWSPTSSGHLLDGVSDQVLERAFKYWKRVDQQLGERVEKTVGAGVA